tara:strand:- start:319 stop:936 length:618 start_codon:yes stop_codon:yes gene_type:complete
MNYKKDGYGVIRKAISSELTSFIYDYFLLKREAAFWASKNNVTHVLLGNWNDKQVPDTYSIYADTVMETVLIKFIPRLQKETGLELVPTYSYARLYKKGDILHRHKDRASCEVSITIHIGGDQWPIFLDPTGKNNSPKGDKVLLEIGDMLIYNGCDLEHWREAFQGNTCGQVFLHYNNVNGPFGLENKFDKRPRLGIPYPNKNLN